MRGARRGAGRERETLIPAVRFAAISHFARHSQGSRRTVAGAQTFKVPPLKPPLKMPRFGARGKGDEDGGEELSGLLNSGAKNPGEIAIVGDGVGGIAEGLKKSILRAGLGRRGGGVGVGGGDDGEGLDEVLQRRGGECLAVLPGEGNGGAGLGEPGVGERGEPGEGADRARDGGASVIDRVVSDCYRGDHGGLGRRCVSKRWGRRCGAL